MTSLCVQFVAQAKGATVLLLLLLLLLLTAGPSTATTTTAPYTVHLYEQQLDHFDPLETRTWQHRYLTNTDSWDGRGALPNGCKGPLLLYTGNEGPITAFWEANGFLLDVLAPKLGAMAVFPEERYYGASLPFGNATFRGGPPLLKYLSTAQILADYAALVTALKAATPGLSNCPVVAFGGSYGGTLTTFLRSTYPNVVVGGLAASAPVGYYDPHHWGEHGVDKYTWAGIVARDYTEAHPRCMQAIQAARALIDATDTATLLHKFDLCEASGLGPTRNSDLFSYALEGMPQLDYPAASGTLPAWPVNDTCQRLVQAMAGGRGGGGWRQRRLLGARRGELRRAGDAALLDVAAFVTKRALGVSFARTAAPGGCIPTLPEGPGDIPGDGPGGVGAWSWQSCTETLHEFASAVARGHIRDFAFDLERSANAPCRALFNDTVTPNPNALAEEFGGYKIGANLEGATNIIWSNGGMDPWHGGGFYPDGKLPDESTPLHRSNPESGNHYIWIRRGAHHGDLRAPSAGDPVELTAARRLEEEIIRGWIMDASKV